MGGALDGIRVVEIGGLGPAPFAAMMLADHGADVVRVERPSRVPLVDGAYADDDMIRYDYLSRGRQCAAIDLKHPDGVALVVELATDADVFIEGFRPGVAERLGIGPEVLRAANDRLVYGRMTGWGRTGPRAERSGHDINYIALAGAQAHIGRAGAPPTPPLNLVGDFGGGAMLLVAGVLAALVERSTSGRGQVVDAAMVDAAALLMAPLMGAHQSGFWSDERGTNLLDSGAPFYDCYECADGGWVSVGAIEPQFYAALIEGLGLSGEDGLPEQHEQDRWPELRTRFTEVFAGRDRDDWAQTFADRDACVAPVLTMGEAPDDPHLRAWGTFVDVDGAVQPAPAPRFSRSVPGPPSPPRPVGADTDVVFERWGIDADRRAELRAAGAIY